MSTLQIAGLAIAGVGVVGVAVGSVFGLMAISSNDESLEPQNCREPSFCSPTGLDLRDDAESRATVSTIGFAVGGVLAAGGVALFLFAPSGGGDGAAIELAPRVGVSEQGLSLRGSF
jgi:hypothetical protein